MPRGLGLSIDADRARRLLHAQSFDFVATNNNRPRTEGIGLTRFIWWELERDQRKGPQILTSRKSNAELVKDARDAGMCPLAFPKANL